MALGREVHHGIDGVTAEELDNRRPLPDVGPHEEVLLITLEIAQILEVPGVGQRVDVHDEIVRPLAPRQAHVR